MCWQVAKGGREAGGSLEKLGYVPVPEGLDLIEPGEQITHQVLQASSLTVPTLP